MKVKKINPTHYNRQLAIDIIMLTQKNSSTTGASHKSPMIFILNVILSSHIIIYKQK